MLRKILLITVSVLLIAVVISSNILIKEMERQISKIDYTIYDIPIKKVTSTIDYSEHNIGELIRVLKEQSKEYKYKFYKKFTLVAYCPCDMCNWEWGTLPRFRKLQQGITVAANPKSLALGTHIMILDNYYTVSYVDESIPTNTIYVYVKYHETIGEDWCTGIHDVYKAK